MTGEILKGRYQIESKIGEGAMGKVYRAIDQTTGDFVAIKMMSKELAKDEAYRKRFGREAAALAKLQHPSIVGYVDAFSLEGDGYLVTEYFAGGDLRNMLTKKGALPSGTFKGMAIKIVDAVAAAHEVGIIHRDLKPENILMTLSGEPKVGDFGLARDANLSTMTATGTVMGTLAYMPPEAFDAFMKQDQRGDIWALGVILFEMLTTGLPFRARSQTELIAAILNDRPISLLTTRRDVPPAWDTIIELCLQKDVHQRYQSARDLLADLRADRVGASHTPTYGMGMVAAAPLAAPPPIPLNSEGEIAIKPLSRTGPSSSGLRYMGSQLEEAQPSIQRHQPNSAGLMFLTNERPVEAAPPRYGAPRKKDLTGTLLERDAPKNAATSMGIMMVGGLFLWAGICVVLLSSVLLVILATQGEEAAGVSFGTISVFQALGSFMFAIGLFFEIPQETDWRQGAMAGLGLAALALWVIFFSRLIFAELGTIMGMVGYILLILMYFQLKRGY